MVGSESDMASHTTRGKARHTLLHGGRRDALASDVDLEVGKLGKASRQD